MTLFELAQDLSSPGTLVNVTDVISRHLRRLIPCSLCIIFVYEVSSDEIVLAHADGDNASLVAGLRMALGQRLSGWVAAHRQTIRNSDPVLDLGEAARAIAPRPRSCLSTPLELDTELVGVLTLYSTGIKAFSEEHQRVIEAISRQVAPIVRRSSTTVTTNLSSEGPKTPELPSLEHLRQFTEAIGLTELPRPTSILTIVVETSGEAGRQKWIGDEQRLATIVETVKRHLRTGDLVFRQSSNELLVLLLRTDVLTATSMGLRIQRGAKESHPPVALEVYAATVAARDEKDKTILQLVQQAAASINKRGAIKTREDSSSGSIH